MGNFPGVLSDYLSNDMGVKGETIIIKFKNGAELTSV